MNREQNRHTLLIVALVAVIGAAALVLTPLELVKASSTPAVTCSCDNGCGCKRADARLQKEQLMVAYLAARTQPPNPDSTPTADAESQLRRAWSVGLSLLVLLVGLLALPVRLALYPIRWLGARREFHEAAARHQVRESEWNVLSTRFAEMPLTNETTECFTVQ